jgi:Mn-dependent DtxR family transcriptional regulator/Fe2+ transport system protein FeoA
VAALDDVFKMYKEDLLRAILEFGKENGEADTKDLLDDMGGEQRLFEQAALDLEKENLITKNGTRIVLTPEGREAAEKIYAKHRFIEEHFSAVFNESDVHILAHALEHCVSDSLLAKMRGELALIGEALNLSDLKTGEQATILALAVSDKKLFSRLLGIGLSPRSKVRIFEKLQDHLVIEVEDRKIALDTLIANKILVSKEEDREKSG